MKQPEKSMVIEDVDKLGQLGLGAVTDPQTMTWVVRTKFFSLTDKKARSAVEDLFARCEVPFLDLKKISKEQQPKDLADFPPVVLTTITESSETRRLHYVEDWNSLCTAAKQFPCAEELRKQLWKWTEERNLSEEWFLTVMYRMLCFPTVPGARRPWVYPGVSGRQGNRRFGGPLGANLPQVPSRQPLPSIQPYNPAVQNRDEFLLDVQKQFIQYCGEVEEEFKRNGFSTTIRKRQRSGPTWMHLEWFIRNRIELWSPTRIAAEHRVTADVVTRAIRSTAGQLGFKRSRRSPAED